MHILTGIEHGVMTVEFNRPDRKNALTAAMYEALAQALRHAAQDPGVRVVLFKGSPQFFSAGNDIDEFLSHPPTGDDSPVYRFLTEISRAEKPLIAAVAGVAVGIGTTMLLHCDLIYAAENASFSMPFTRLGLCPEAASSFLLPRLGGYPRAAEKLLFGEAFSVEEARDMGLISRIVPASSLEAFATERARVLAALPAASVRITKRLLKESLHAGIAQALGEEAKQFRVLLQGPDAREAFQAFAEKRKPDFGRSS